MAFELTPERLSLFEELLPRYPTRQALTIPLLHLCQEQNGYITPEVVAYVAKRLGLTTADLTVHSGGNIGQTLQLRASSLDLGALPELPGQLTPVWELLKSRIQQPR